MLKPEEKVVIVVLVKGRVLLMLERLKKYKLLLIINSYLCKFVTILTNISILIGPLGEKNASIEAVAEEIP